MNPTSDISPRAIPKTGTPEWAAWHASERLVDVEYVGKMEAVAFRFGDGRIIALPLSRLQGTDATPVTRISLVHEGDAALIEQFSGNHAEVPWDYVLYLADPTHPCRSHEAGRGTADTRLRSTPWPGWPMRSRWGWWP